eukprot:4611175-Prorocentrum_lima.AAC.1
MENWAGLLATTLWAPGFWLLLYWEPMAHGTRDRLHGTLKRVRPGEWGGQRFLRGKYVDEVAL